MKKNAIITEALRPLAHMQPSIRISPFLSTEWESLLQKKTNKKTSRADKPSFWLNRAKDLIYYDRGRTALLACLKHLGLKRDDEVLIVTTTDGPYISGCVTKTIEKVCKWKRKQSARTRLVLVIHEFGFPCPYKKVQAYHKEGLPILEDCAYAFGSRYQGASVGTFGDFALYSLPKYFPFSFGGILAACNKINKAGRNLKLPSISENLLKQSIRSSLPTINQWNKSRRANWQFFVKNLPRRFKPYFPCGSKIVPGVYLTKVPKKFTGEKVKKRLNTAGVESTQYYHQGGFYFPVHQFLTEYDRQYILHHFLNQQ